MSFKEIQFPSAISLRGVGGPGFRTSVSRTLGGWENRDQTESSELGGWQVAYDARLSDLFKNQFIPFFYIVQGRLYGFRYKDWVDYKVEVGEGVFVQVGSPSDYQMAKLYQFGGFTYTRIIQKPVQGTVTVTGGGAIDYTTGIVAGAPTAWTGEFDCPARLDIDKMDVEVLDKRSAGSQLILGWHSIAIAEIKV